MQTVVIYFDETMAPSTRPKQARSILDLHEKIFHEIFRFLDNYTIYVKYEPCVVCLGSMQTVLFNLVVYLCFKVRDIANFYTCTSVSKTPFFSAFNRECHILHLIPSLIPNFSGEGVMIRF